MKYYSEYEKNFEKQHGFTYCGRQEEPPILISGLLLRMRHMYVASTYLDFH